MSLTWPRPWRVLAGSALAGIGLYSLVTLAAAPATVLAGGCSKTNPKADLLITQSAVGNYDVNGAAQSVTFTLTAENEGPCSATGLTVSAMVADSAVPSLAITVVSTNPSSGSCTPPVGVLTPGGSLSCLFSKLSAPSDANTNNPGTAIVTFTVTNAAPNGNLGGAGAAPVTSLATVSATSPPSATADPDLGNNTSHGAFLVDGGSLTFSDFQTTTVSVPTGQGLHGAAEIEPGVKDPNPPKGSFGQIVLINSDAFLDSTGNPATPLQTVTFDVPITSSTPNSTSKVQVWHELDGTTTWVQVPDCTNSVNQPDPAPSCVFSISKLKGGPTGSYFEIVVYTTVTSKWVS